jgi:2-aminoadipate transaminase
MTAIGPALSAASRRTDDSPISDLMARALAAPDLISLAAGFVDQGTLPAAPVAEAAAGMLADPIEGKRSLQYGTTRGDLHLRRRLVAFLEQSEGAKPGEFDHFLDRTVVTSGSQQLLYLVAEALLDPGDIVLVESPTYFVFLGVLQTRGAEVIGIETDGRGMRIDALEATLADLERQGRLDRVKLIYTIPEHSNPTGLSLASDRRAALVKVAEAHSKSHRIYILEDAAYRGLTFEGAEPPSVWSHDASGETVILARTFSKTFSPGLKTGYGVIPDALLKPILNLKGLHDFGSNHFVQEVIERAMSDGAYERQIALLRTRYKAKRDALLSALDTHLGPFGVDVSWTRPNGGLYVWITFPEGVDTGRDGSFFSRCVDEGVLYVPGAFAFPDLPEPGPRNTARLSFGVASEPALFEGARRLASALTAQTRAGLQARSSDRRLVEKKESPARTLGVS